MPPKKNKASGPTNKTLEKEKKKVVEDKTFGLKNKNKSKVVQQKISMVTHQVMDGGTKKVRSSSTYDSINSIRFLIREANALKRK